MRQTRQPGAVARRSFLKGATLVGAAAVAPPLAAAAPVRPAARPALPIQLAAAENREPPREQPLTEGRSGGDFMVDVLKSLDFEYVCANPASSFRGLHESLINYGKNTGPEFITCTHEEAAVAMAHAYAKIEGKPIAVMAHAVVGLQHASMALYNAWCDRAPVFLMVGNSVNAEMRRPGVEWAHTAQDNAVIVRDFVKWDDQPASLQDFAESAVRAYKIAVTPPMGPVVLAIDSELQEGAIEEEAALAIPKLPRSTLPEGDSAAVAETARLLVAAETPVILADRLARTPAGIARLVELAELLQAPVIDQGGRMNFPSRHKLNHSGRARPLISQADVILGLELNDFWGTLHSYRDQLHRSSKLLTRAGVKTVAIGTGDLYLKSNFQNFQRFAEIDLAIAGDGEETLPALIEAAKRLVTDDRRSVFAARGQKLAEARAKLLAADRDDAVYGWCQPDQHGAAVRGAVGPDREGRLVSRHRHHLHQPLAAAPLGDGEAPPLYRRFRRRRPRLWRRRHRRRGAGQPQARPHHRGDRGRRRSHVFARRAVDRGAPPHPAPDDRPQQPRLSSGIYACAAHGGSAQPRPRPHLDRHHLARALHRLCQAGAGDGRLCRGAGQRSPGDRPGNSARARGRQARRAGARRRRDPAALGAGEVRVSSFSLVAAALLLAGVSAAARAQDSGGDESRGKQLYVDDGCYECHGYVGQGSSVAGPRVATLSMSFDNFTRQLRRPANEMPPYGETALTDQDAADIYAYLRSIPAPKETAKDIPLLNR